MQRYLNLRTGRIRCKRFLFPCIFFALLATSCSFGPYYNKSVRSWETAPVPDSSTISYTVYLIGDAGGPNLAMQEPSLKLLQSFLVRDTNSSVLFLGDNIYFDGMPPVDASHRELAEKKIREEMNILKDYKGNVYFVAGNHDWDYMKQAGLEHIRLEEQYIENYLNRGNTFVPDNGCPGPYFTPLTGNVVLLAVDSQWWLHKYEKPYGRCADCSAEDEQDMLVQLEDYIKNNRNKHILLVAHHPLVSNGNHGGYYNVLDHIFPLRLIRPNWFIPIPVIGSIYPLFRKFGGVDQDIPHYRYQEYRDAIVDVISHYDNVIYAAGHDHNLQLHQTDSINHIISGSGSKISPVKGGVDALYTHKHKGFAMIRYYKNGEAWVEFWVPEGDGSEGRMTFRHLLYTRKTGMPESYCSLSATDYSDSTITTIASDRYEAGKLKTFLLGNHYREEWTTPVNVPFLDLKTAKGGLIPYGIGGRKQSVSLKLKNLDDRLFVLRMVNKDPTKAVPANFRNTIFQDIVEDQISAQHPYGALTIGPMADAIGVYHTNPELVMIPNDSCLGPYREQFKNSLAIIEEDPDENHEDVASLGNAKNIVGTDRMRERLESDNDNRVDVRNLLRARLLDMLLGDWDRHDRQYRWSVIETRDGEIYRTIPEDRDQVYFRFDGVIPYLASRKWAIRNLQNFEHTFKDVKGLNLSARFLDKRYLPPLSRKDWTDIADSVAAELTDATIEESIRRLPDSIYLIHGPEIASRLKSRRDQLRQAAEKYYEILSGYVDIFGSDKNEKFVVERLDNRTTRVTVFKVNKEGEVKNEIYKREFYRKETKEIRLYGLGGKDDFVITGEVSRGIKIRIIGGADEDTLKDESKVSGIVDNTLYYDTKKGNVVNKSRETQLHLTPGEVINYPVLDKFSYDYLGPRISIAYNQDDGAFLGAGFVYKSYKFRSNPYGSRHSFLISRATTTGSTRLEYTGDIKNFIRKFDLSINFDMYTPVFVMNYFGYGNESVQTRDYISYYRTRLQQTLINPSLNKEITRYFKVGVGPQYQYFRLLRKPNTFLNETVTDPSLYTSRNYAGMRAFFSLGTRDNERNPTRGIVLTGEANYNLRLDKKGSYSKYLSEFSFYITPNLPIQLTFASRLGGGMNFGSFEFYQANALGSTFGIGQAGNLRGFRKTRFIGDKSLYHNAEVRLQVLRFNSYIFTSKAGVLGFIDNGRVWAKNEISHKWHTGYGGGVWFDLYNSFILTATYGISKDDQVVNVRMGFLF